MLRTLILLCLAPDLTAALHTITGCVKDQQGAPVPGAVIRMTEMEGPVRLQIRADDHGCYRQELVPDGAYEVRAEQSGASGVMRQVVLDEKKAKVTVDLLFQPPAEAAKPADAAPPIVNLNMLSNGASPEHRGHRAGALLKSVSFNVDGVDSGDPAMGRITLSKPAPLGGVTIQLAVSNRTLAEVPPEITIGKGLTGEWFPIQTSRLRGPADVSLTVEAIEDADKQSAELILHSYTRITVRFEGEGTGAVVSSPAGVNCPERVCSHPFREEESVRLIARPAPGSAFLGWSGDCDKDGVVLVNRPVSCGAAFSRQ